MKWERERAVNQILYSFLSPKPRQKRLVFVWPQRKKDRWKVGAREREKRDMVVEFMVILSGYSLEEYRGIPHLTWSPNDWQMHSRGVGPERVGIVWVWVPSKHKQNQNNFRLEFFLAIHLLSVLNWKCCFDRLFVIISNKKWCFNILSVKIHLKLGKNVLRVSIKKVSKKIIDFVSALF